MYAPEQANHTPQNPQEPDPLQNPYPSRTPFMDHPSGPNSSGLGGLQGSGSGQFQRHPSLGGSNPSLGGSNPSMGGSNPSLGGNGEGGFGQQQHQQLLGGAYDFRPQGTANVWEGCWIY